MKKIVRAAAAIAGVAALSAFIPTAAYADTLRGSADSNGCLAFLGSTYSGGHDWVRYTSANPTNHECHVFMRTYLSNGQFYDHDDVYLTPYASYNSGWYLDSGVRTAVCVDQPRAGDSRSCSLAY
ncbi:hypothetical protein AB0L41_46650 [Amycolatopsis mediterranei]|uniref:hypothetical protein n=1 Tax=Amycolatopsis mediterranei TaxID=33910 RepID=UPI0034339A7E